MNNALGTSLTTLAQRLGISPVDLATAISYETGGTFDAAKKGPTTKWGQHVGLIQMGEPQRKKYGYDPEGSTDSQMDAIGRYLTDTGVKPGMGLEDIYSAINAGGVGRYNRSDVAAGGAPGTVSDKVMSMGPHQLKALNLLGMTNTPGMSLATSPGLPTGPAVMAPGGGVGAAAVSELNNPAQAMPAGGMGSQIMGMLGNKEGMAALGGLASAISGPQSSAPELKQSSIGADGQQAAISQGAAQMMAQLLAGRRGMRMGA